MAFIYRYHLRNKSERDQKNLTEYTEVLKTTLEARFEKNIKEIIIEDNYFQFKLFVSVATHELNSMGKAIKKSGFHTEFGVVRKNVEFYAVVTDVDDEQRSISIDFIDASVGNKEVFLSRVRDFAIQNELTEFSDEIKRNYYVDVFSGQMSKEELISKTGLTEIEVGDCFKTRVLHKHGEASLGSKTLERIKDVVSLENLVDYQYRTKQNDFVENVENDYFVIESVSQMSKDDFRDKTKVLDYEELKRNSLSDNTLEEFFKNIKKGKIIDFCVHNVGQALATSFAYEAETPFMYFDYGLPNVWNRHTLPKDGVSMPTNVQTKIILSHVHTDHWLGLKTFMDAYKCMWYVPDQERPAFKKEIANIQVAGGNVVILSKSINGTNFVLSYLEKSATTLNPPGKHLHETGDALCVIAKDLFGNVYKILDVGDQYYDYLIPNFLHDVNCLVACHHGGTYNRNRCAIMPTPNGVENTVIYSYGKDNKYGHPNNNIVLEYRTAGWENEHHMPGDKDYVKKIML